MEFSYPDLYALCIAPGRCMQSQFIPGVDVTRQAGAGDYHAGTFLDEYTVDVQAKLRFGRALGAVPQLIVQKQLKLIQSGTVDEVALRYDARESLYTQQAQKLQVFQGLRHGPVVCRHYQHAEVDAIDPGYHGVDEALVTRSCDACSTRSTDGSSLLMSRSPVIAYALPLWSKYRGW